MSIRMTLLTLSGAALVSACQANQPLETVDHVDIERFMGDWYVIANIPTFLEEGAHNAVENYRLDDDGTIATTFTYRKDGFDGKEKSYHPRGFIRDTTTHAEWGMQFVWPIKADYRIIYLSDDYSLTIIGRNKRDYVWLMAREPGIPDARYRQAVEFIAASGYDISRLKRVPQEW